MSENVVVLLFNEFNILLYCRQIWRSTEKKCVTDSLTALKKCGKTTSLPLAPGSEEPMWPMREK